LDMYTYTYRPLPFSQTYTHRQKGFTDIDTHAIYSLNLTYTHIHTHTHTAIEHQLAPIFRQSLIAPEAAEVYMENLRRYGYDNIYSLHSIANDRCV
jgi:hypothetical protein